MDIFITGATSGFGKAIAEKFALAGNRLWLTGRRTERLEEIKERLVKDTGVEVKISQLDVRNKADVNLVDQELIDKWGQLDLLVNNAGLALGLSTIDEGDTDDWDTMIDTNIKGLLYVTRALSPLFRKQKRGHIINIGSTAGKSVYQNGNVYCATKFAVDALNQTMRIDLLPYHVKVTAINPGMAETEFSLVRFKGDEERATKTYQGFKALKAEDIADAAFYCAMLPPHVCINDLTITCTQQANSVYKTNI